MTTYYIKGGILYKAFQCLRTYICMHKAPKVSVLKNSFGVLEFDV